MSQEASHPVAGRRRRALISSRRGLVAVVALLAVAAAGAFALPKFSKSTQEATPLLHKVERGEFAHDVTERGELESAKNVEIRCEVKSLGTSGTTIIEIVPEGTVVQEDDILVKLDSSALENDRTRQQIAVANSEAEVIKARTAVSTAQATLKEYINGTFVQSEQLAIGDLAVAKENFRRAEEYLLYSNVLAKKGYITTAQLDADKFAVEKARADLEASTTKLKVLRDFSRAKMVAQLESDILTAQAKLKAQEHSNDLELTKLADIEGQIEKCVIRAPCPGQVVYANQTNTWGGREIIIEAGSTVRERQEIVRLPDHHQMQVKAKINEAKVSMVAVGMPVGVRLDAFPDQEFQGVVHRVNEYPAPSNRYTSSVKEYETVVRLTNPPPGARPGLTAEVRIHVEHLSGVLQVPVQALFEHGNAEYAVFRDAEEGWVARPVQIGSTNDKFVVIRDGLAEGQEIVLNAAAFRSKVKLPELPAEKAAPQVAVDKSKLPQGPQRGGLSEAAPVKQVKIALSDPNSTAVIQRLLKQFDKDKDGRIALSHLPDSLRAQLKTGDANRDGQIDRTELSAILGRITARQNTTANAERPGTAPGP